MPRRASLALALLLLSACGGTTSNRPRSYSDNARIAYRNAFAAFEDGDCLTAEPLLSNIRSRYPYSRYAALSELRIADCHLKQSRPIQAIRAYRSFIRRRPAHPEIPYARFKVAESYYTQLPGGFFLSAPPRERDQTATREAVEELSEFLNDFPDSEYVEQAREWRTRAFRLLAQHELYVAEFYLARDRPEAALGRLRTVIEDFQGSGVVPQALLVLGRTYLRLRRVREARSTFQRLLREFPDDGYAVQANNYLARFEQ